MSKKITYQQLQSVLSNAEPTELISSILSAVNDNNFKPFEEFILSWRERLSKPDESSDDDVGYF